MSALDIDIKTHRSLYLGDEPSVIASLAHARLLPDSSDDSIAHMYWRNSGNFSEKQFLSLVSAASRGGFESVILWSSEPIDVSAAPSASNRIWDPEKELSFAGLGDCWKKFVSATDDKCYLDGDLFRLLCLYNYGGIYLDADTVTLRSLKPLFGRDFIYQWGSSGTTSQEPSLEMNGAIMGFRKGSPNLRRFLEVATRTHLNKNTTCLGKNLYKEARDNKTLVLPCAWFNTEWCMARPTNPFSEEGARVPEDGAFVWHWHNQWFAPIHPKSKFRRLTDGLKIS